MQDIAQICISNKISSGEKNYKYFICYLYNDYKVKPLYPMLPKTCAYVKSYNGKTKWMYFFVFFFIERDYLLEKYYASWYKISTDIKREFDSDKKVLETKKKISWW